MQQVNNNNHDPSIFYLNDNPLIRKLGNFVDEFFDVYFVYWMI